MSLYKKLFGIIVDNLLHLSAGLVITYTLINYCQSQHYLFIYLIGISFAILPDFDILKPLIVAILKKKKDVLDSSHKFNFMHWPLIMVPSAFIIIFIFEPVLALIAGLNLLSHYIIDTAQSGSRGVGIQWLAPFFSKDFFRFFSPHRIKEKDINQYVMSLEKWIEEVILNLKYPEFWINIGVFILSLFYIFT